MTNIKSYPDQAPHHYSFKNNERLLCQTFKGCAVGILDHGDIQILEIVMERLSNNNDEDYAKFISNIINDSKDRMSKLHEVLGAFDINGFGELTKSEDQRIDWESF